MQYSPSGPSRGTLEQNLQDNCYKSQDCHRYCENWKAVRKELLEKLLTMPSWRKSKRRLYSNFWRVGMCDVLLPTGYGKSPCYITLPTVFDKLRNVKKVWWGLFMLLAWMKDQIATIMAMGVSCSYSHQWQRRYEHSDEAIDREWRQPSPLCLARSLDCKIAHLLAFSIDEAHWISKSCIWGVAQ